ncbi:MAG: hypothetical protein P0S96_04425 [Simkaniaceae bacterium]|nr:hypothetical protein [Candidatus Sacchlamyda saccharinae]
MALQAQQLLAQCRDFLNRNGFNHWRFEANALGRDWEIVDGKHVQEKGGKGPLYVHDPSCTTCVKNWAQIAFLPESLAIMGVRQLRESVSVYQRNRNVEELKNSGIQAAVLFATGLGALYLDEQFFGIGAFGYGTLRTALFAYAAFHPFGAKVYMAEAEKFVNPKREGAMTNDCVARLSPWGTLEALTEGTLPLAHLFNQVGDPTPIAGDGAGKDE